MQTSIEWEKADQTYLGDEASWKILQLEQKGTFGVDGYIN